MVNFLSSSSGTALILQCGALRNESCETRVIIKEHILLKASKNLMVAYTFLSHIFFL